MTGKLIAQKVKEMERSQLEVLAAPGLEKIIRTFLSDTANLKRYYLSCAIGYFGAESDANKEFALKEKCILSKQQMQEYGIWNGDYEELLNLASKEIDENSSKHEARAYYRNYEKKLDKILEDLDLK